MSYKFFPDKQIRNSQVARPVSSRVFAWLVIIAIAGGLIATGFVMSARQHFEAVSLGYETEELRRQLFQLEEKLRQIELEHARASSPVEIERRAKKIGLERLKPESPRIRRPTTR
jgi:hypothetical protein